MKKLATQEGAQETDTQEPRKLNIEEKRKLEKLLMADIESATERYNAVTKAARGALIERLQRTPLAEAKAVYERRNLAVKQREELQQKLNALGYDVNYNWPAPGSADTELGVLMEPEVDHGEAEVYTRVQA